MTKRETYAALCKQWDSMGIKLIPYKPYKPPQCKYCPGYLMEVIQTNGKTYRRCSRCNLWIEQDDDNEDKA